MMELAALQFEEFPKISRLFREVSITEKIDGTNAQIIVQADGAVQAASRSRLVTPEDDNYGFAKWVKANEDELRQGLGEGRHFGEWWGSGIQRNYSQTTKRFSLFNTHKWTEVRPACCDVVPIIWAGIYSPSCVHDALKVLRNEGSKAAPGFMKPEGIIIWHTAAQTYFKVTLEKDDEWKGKAG